jgi:hypothetical protein
VFLASPLASYVVGQTIVVDGGLIFCTPELGQASTISSPTITSRSERDGQGSNCRFGKGFRR